MTFTKRLGLGALLFVAVALFTTTPALAQGTTITFTNTADPADQDSLASGQATLTNVAYSYTYTEGGANCSGVFVCDVYTADLTVSCTGLTPGATYRIGPTGFQYVFDKKSKTYYRLPAYSSVQASGTGTVELALQVRFVGSVSTYALNGPCGSNAAYYVLVGTSYPDYPLSVARRIKHTSSYIPVLQGAFLSPASSFPPPPPFH